MMEKFTKGPWRYEGATGFIESGEYSICDLMPTGMHSVDADGHLIAAAPEMYEMLKWLSVAVLKDGSIAHKNAVELLAKARGEK